MTSYTFHTLLTFNGYNGDIPGGLMLDAAGDLYGVTVLNGVNYGSNGDISSNESLANGNGGEVFELINGSDALNIVHNFSYTILGGELQDGDSVVSGLVQDASGNIYGGAFNGLPPYGGTIYELAAGTQQYSTISVPSPSEGNNGPCELVSDAAGNIYGMEMAEAGLSIEMWLFKISADTHTYSYIAPLEADRNPGNFSADAAGNLYGTYNYGPDSVYGSVFEVTAGSNAVTILENFDGYDGNDPSDLTVDAKGDLYGLTIFGGAHGLGTVFEIAAGTTTITTLASFSSANGTLPEGRLVIDSTGDVFGMTAQGGAHGFGTVFEVAAGSQAITTLFSLTTGDTEGSGVGGLIADAAGNMYGSAAYGGAAEDGIVFELTADDNPALCYCPGTLIATERGDRLIESLAIGDRVTTLGGAHRRIRWIGRRAYAGAFIAGRHLMLPVCIKAGAIDEGQPSRDLWVSPGHAVLIDGRLIPAWRLINGISVVQAATVDQVAYIHLELDRHDVIFANGMPAESFLDEDCRGQFHNAAEFHALYPGAKPVTPYAPRLENGFELARIQRRIAARAGIATPWPRTLGPLRGYVDEIEAGFIRGWAQDELYPEEPVSLLIQVDGRTIVLALANAYRADLRAAGLGSGCHSFAAQLPAGLMGQVEVRRSTDFSMLDATQAALARTEAERAA